MDNGASAPPQAPEGEVSVLGGLLIDPDAIPIVLGLLTESMFHHEPNRRIFRSVVRLHGRGVAGDLAIVGDDLRATGELDSVGGIAYLAELQDAVPTAANIEYHARTVLEAARWRSLERVFPAAREIREGGGTVDDALSAARGRIERLEAASLAAALPKALPLSEAPPPEPIRFAVDTLITAREPAMIVGPDGQGKTTILVHILCATIVGEPVFDRFDVLEGPVLLVSEEDSADVLANHAAAIAKAHGWDWERIRGGLHVLALTGVQLDQSVWREHILSEIKRIGAVAAGFDPYADLTSAEENSNDQVRPVKAFLREVGKAGATPILCHHAGKAGKPGEKSKKDRIRGATALGAACRSILFIEHNDMGLTVESLKLSRARAPRPFVVSLDVESDEGDTANWQRARLLYVTERQAEEDAADRFVLDTLERYPFSNSTEIKELAKGSGLAAPQVSAAIKRLHLLRRIEFEAGKRNSKHWYRPDISSLPKMDGQAGQGTLPSLPNPARQARGGPDEPAPLDREGRIGQGPRSAGQADVSEYEEEWESIRNRGEG